jgi:membrane protein DedA with SNARE-associated domain
MACPMGSAGALVGMWSGCGRSTAARIFGPVRAIVPLTAGILRMPPGRFWLANIASAIIWAPLILFPGAAITETMGRLTVGEEHAVPVVVIAILVLGAAAWVIWRRRR